jgi:WD40 repeat protein
MIAVMKVGLLAAGSRPSHRHLAGPALILLVAFNVAGCSLWSSPTHTPAPTATPSPTPEPTPTPVVVPSPQIGSFQTAGSMTAGRVGATATLLPDGRVLIAGGAGGGKTLASAELFNPRTGAFTPTGSMLVARASQSANLLPNGRVLICGSGSRSCEVFDPASGKFAKSGTLGYGPLYQTATTLGDGRVLVAGGISGGTYSSRAEIYNAATGRFVHVRSLKDPLEHAVGVLLQDGRVLIAGGDQGDSGKHPVILASAELFSPVSATFARAGSMLQARSHFAGVLLQNGKVLVMGGLNMSVPAHLLMTAELFDPNSGQWSSTGPMTVGRSDFTATLLADGRVLVAGGGDNTTEIYDPATGEFSMGPFMLEARVSQTATVLADTRLLMAGGSVNGDSSAEMFNP